MLVESVTFSPSTGLNGEISHFFPCSTFSVKYRSKNHTLHKYLLHQLEAKSIMPNFTFARGKSALITGGASGIGLAVAQRCVRAGMRVLIADNNANSLESAKKVLGGGVSTVEMDVARAEDWKGLRESLKNDWEGSSTSSSRGFGNALRVLTDCGHNSP